MINNRLKFSILFVFSIILLIGLSSVIVYALCPHGVAICGDNYDCSDVSDGICPEDYGATCCDAGCSDYDVDCGQKCCIDSQCAAVCTWCDASFQCNEIPVDDPNCGVIDCDGLNNYFQRGTESPNATETCYYQDYDDLSNNRCEDLGDCKDPNSDDCVAHTNTSQYTCGICKYIGASDCTGATLGSCSYYAIGTSCPDDGDACTRNECNSTGYCEYTNYCSGTDTSCGCTSCINCNTGGTGAGRTGDGCLNDAYIDYSCSGTSCTYTSDDCSDCSCSCGDFGLASEAGFCTDGKDNDCDSECDYDNMVCTHGDDNCAVSITADPVVSNNNPCPGEIINVTCTSNVGSINSIDAFIDSTKCSYIEDSWVGNTVKFRCTSSSTPTTQTIMCAVNNSKSYQSGVNRTTQITVGGIDCCNQYPNPANCEGDIACDWCLDCTGPKWSGGISRCVAAGTCSPYCWQGECGATCDETNGGCSDYCSGDTLYFNVVCDDATCACTPGSPQDCSLSDCSFNLSCGGVGTSTIANISDNYTCSEASCVVSGTMICADPWTCSGANNCTFQMCNGTSYQCYYYNGWKWGLSAPIIETNCTDGYDNDCDGDVDKNDSNCDEICDNDIDDDDDGAIDGLDSDCQEGKGSAPLSPYRGCEEGTDNDGDGLYDKDDPGCCDFCLADPNNGFDNFLGEPCGVGCDCGSLIFNWEKPATMEEYCCGDDIGKEFFINTTIGSNNYYACCDNGSDCVDSNGDCQIGKEELFELCSNGEDDDCDSLVDKGDTTCQGQVSGYVYDEDNSPISGATVKGSPPGLGSEYESNATTGPFGGYTINEALVGEYSFVAKKDGYDDKVMIINVTAGTPVQVNFSVRNGSCHEDCTDYYGNCNPTCDGVEFNDTNCTFISPLCQGRPEGFIVRDIISGTVYEYTCCEGPMRSYPVLNATVKGDVESLYDYVFNVKLKGRYVRMHILVWKPK